MFKHNTKQWVGTDDTQTDIIMKGSPLKAPETIFGVGLVLGGLAFMMYGAWKTGGEDYLKAESKALRKIGCLDMTDGDIEAIKF